MTLRAKTGGAIYKLHAFSLITEFDPTGNGARKYCAAVVYFFFLFFPIVFQGRSTNSRRFNYFMQTSRIHNFPTVSINARRHRVYENSLASLRTARARNSLNARCRIRRNGSRVCPIASKKLPRRDARDRRYQIPFSAPNTTYFSIIDHALFPSVVRFSQRPIGLNL